MSNVLDPSEVEALLAAVDTGQVPREQRLSAAAEPEPYDFKHPQRLSREKIAALESLHQTFARELAADLSGYLNTTVAATVADVAQLTGCQFMQTLPEPTLFSLLDAQPSGRQVCLEIGGTIAYTIISRLLGGRAAEPFVPQRRPTQIERRLLGLVVHHAAQCLSAVWSAAAPAALSPGDLQSDPQLASVALPHESVVVVALDLKLADRMGRMNLCMPVTVIEPIISAMARRPRPSAAPEAGPDNLPRLAAGLNDATLELRALLAQTSMHLGELLALRLGDVVTTDKPADAEVAIQIDGKTKFTGRLGHLRGNRAVGITRRHGPDEDASPGDRR